MFVLIDLQVPSLLRKIDVASASDFFKLAARTRHQIVANNLAISGPKERVPEKRSFEQIAISIDTYLTRARWRLVLWTERRKLRCGL